MIADLGRLSRTVGQLRPIQIGQRARLRAQRAVISRSVPLAARWLLAGPDGQVGPGWPPAFTPLDASLWADGQTGKALRSGELLLLGSSRAVAKAGPSGDVRWAEADWEAAGEPLLWRYHLYYWDWAWALTAEAPDPDLSRVFTAMWRSWRAAVAPGYGPAWHPYPAALRAWSFCGLCRHFVEGGPIEEAFRADLALHAGFLRRNLEMDVGGNHLIKNLKALIGLAIFFGDETLLRRTLHRLSRQLRVQVLADGGHFERAPAYHCQVLADLIDIDGLLGAAGRTDPGGLPEAIAAMRDWLGAVQMPSGDVPMLNDGFPVSRALLAQTAPSARAFAQLHVLPDTGLIRLVAGPWHVLADVGPPCPRELPAHAHADTLSCVAHLDGVPLLIDTGTSTYAAGPARDRERSTAAHNTVEVDSCDSTEVWGAFRAGRRARVTGVSVWAGLHTVEFEAAHDGFRNLPGKPMHRRRVWLCADELRVEDEVTGRGRHRVTVRWHLAPGADVRLNRGGALVTTAAGPVKVVVSAPGEPGVRTATALAATGFETTLPVQVLLCTLNCELPVRISTIWRAESLQEST